MDAQHTQLLAEFLILKRFAACSNKACTSRFPTPAPSGTYRHPDRQNWCRCCISSAFSAWLDAPLRLWSCVGRSLPCLQKLRPEAIAMRRCPNERHPAPLAKMKFDRMIERLLQIAFLPLNQWKAFPSPRQGNRICIPLTALVDFCSSEKREVFSSDNHRITPRLTGLIGAIVS